MPEFEPAGSPAGFQPLRNAIREHLIESAVAKGYERGAAVKALAKMEADAKGDGDHPIRDFLLSESFIKLLTLLLQLLPLFLTPAPTQAEAV